MVRLTRFIVATDPRDKVYALLGITNSNLTKLNIAPDYHKTVSEVNIAVAKAIIEDSTSLEMLSIPAGRGTDATVDLPSWVPHWDDTCYRRLELARDRRYVEIRPQIKDLRVFSASGVSQASPRVLHDNKLVVQGYPIDEIVTVAQAYQDDQQMTQQPLLWNELSAREDSIGLFKSIKSFFIYIKGLIGVLDEWSDFAGMQSGSNEDFEVFARTLRADLDLMTAVSESREWLSTCRLLLDFLDSLPSFDIPLTEEDCSRFLGSFVDAVNDGRLKGVQKHSVLVNKHVHLLGRRLARTSEGRLCLLPSEAQVGDVLYLLQGSSTPHLLRKKDGDFEHVGEAFVHGMMYGELWCEELCHEIHIC